MTTPPAAPAPAPGAAAPTAPYDALVLLSFGGPERPEDVVPFLENVTRGRGIPRERLEEVGEHYYAFGGRSPINEQNLALLAALRAELAARGADLPVVWGNRNWDPYLTDALREAHDAGARRVLVLATSAYASYSGCRQYREDVAASLIALAGEGRALHADKLRHYSNHPGFVAANTDAVVEALESLPPDARDGARLVFVTHSIPTAMAQAAGPRGGAYEAQHEDVVAEVTARVGERTGRALASSLVYCSRSGPPSQPWLEPDVNDHLRELAGEGVPGAVVAPIGFVSDHMEVKFDLDTEAAETAQEVGLPVARAATAGVHAAFVAGLVDLVLERAAVERGESPRRPATGALGPSHDVCPVGCCRNLRAPDRPAACGQDWTDPAVPA
ncbi:ferrochelatase [Quadrisphaera sp. DSM 44207]|uniref:ferrochelatase n=1 Tax=Quadrisphaera sp. DSM 44207 TaxID=1881057 RepID=UPI0008824B77|nr:ferrochelatase [Quadrisphaera sp. DSM 44207]SDQ50303.1 ferrochelatase [Quadrisphaera sp. DSM 44207]